MVGEARHLLAAAALAAVALFAGPAEAATATTAASMATSRRDFTATVLGDGRVLVAGGMSSAGGTITKNCELFDPATGKWTAAASLKKERTNHAAILLRDGRVLVAGGTDLASALASVEIYDPATDRWSDATAMAAGRFAATLSLLQDGRVLAAGGYAGGTVTLASVELFTPWANGWAPVGALGTKRAEHTATVLESGAVLVAGGVTDGGGAAMASSEIYNPSAQAWSVTGGPMAHGHRGHTATRLVGGKVLVTGGDPSAGGNGTELYDPTSTTWSLGPNMNAARDAHTATLLPTGELLVAGGSSLPWEVYTYTSDPQTGTWTPCTVMTPACTAYTLPRYAGIAAPLRNGRVLLAGGYDSSPVVYGAAQLVEPRGLSLGSTFNMGTARMGAAAVLLPNGKLLVAGGEGVAGTAVASAELYDPSTTDWQATGAMARPRSNFGAVLLPDGRVLVTGGGSAAGVRPECELYDPSTGAWSSTGAMATPREFHGTWLLPSGRVLVAGGINVSTVHATAELWDPATGTWSPTSALQDARYQFAATNRAGSPVVVGGMSAPGALVATAESYSEGTGWSTLDAPNVPRARAAATTLPSGSILLTGGYATIPTAGSTASAELLDVFTGQWRTVASMGTTREMHASLLLANGDVLVTSGVTANEVERFDPATESWTTVGYLTQREYPAAVLLADGQVLIAGGNDPTAGAPTAAASRISSGPNPDGRLLPVLDPVTSPVVALAPLQLTGIVLGPVEEAGSGRSSGPSFGPSMVQFRSADGRQVWAAIAPGVWPLTVTVPATVPLGRAWVAVEVNGWVSAARPILVQWPSGGGPGTTPPTPAKEPNDSPLAFSCGEGASGPALLAFALLLVALRRRRGRALLVALLAALPAVGDAASPAPPSAAAVKRATGKGRIAVMPVKGGAGVDPQLVEMVTDAFVAALYEQNVPTITMSDIEAALGFERQKQLLGCQDEKSCLAEIAGALGTDRIVSGSLTRVEAVTALRLQLFDSRGALVERRFYETFQDAKAAQLLDAARRAAATLFADWKPGSVAATTTQSEGARPVPSPAPPASAPPAAAAEPVAAAPRPPGRFAVGTMALYDPADPGGVAALVGEWRHGSGLRIDAGPVITGAKSFGLAARAAWTPLSGRLQPCIALHALGVLDGELLLWGGAGVGIEWALSPRLLLSADVPLLRILTGPETYKDYYLLPGLSLRWLL